MHRIVIKWMLCCVLIFQFSCNNRPDDVLSRREMRSFLTELHQLEGVFSSDYSINEDEKQFYYQALFLKHGITKAQFDSSLVYYTKNPKIFERIYTGVNKNLEALKGDVEAGKFLPEIPDSIKFKPVEINIWNLASEIKLPDDTIQYKLNFGISNDQLLTKDLYNFSFRMRAFPNDSVKKGYTAFRIHYADGHVDSLWHQVLNDSVLRRYKFRFNAVRNIKIDSLSGVFFGYNKPRDTIQVQIDSIRLLRKYIPAIQDTLRLKLDTIPLKVIIPDTLKLDEKLPVVKPVSTVKKGNLRK